MHWKANDPGYANAFHPKVKNRLQEKMAGKSTIWSWKMKLGCRILDVGQVDTWTLDRGTLCCVKFVISVSPSSRYLPVRYLMPRIRCARHNAAPQGKFVSVFEIAAKRYATRDGADLNPQRL